MRLERIMFNDIDELNEREAILDQIFSKPFKSYGFKTLLNQRPVKSLRMSYNILGDFYQDRDQKADIVDYFVDEIENVLEFVTDHIHSELLDDLFELVDHNGEMEYTDDTPMRAVSLSAYLIAFPVTKDNKRKLVMSKEVLNYFYELDREDLYKQVETNDLIVQYNRSLVEYFGAFPIDLLIHYLNQYEGLALEEDMIHLLLNIDGLYTNLFDVSQGYIISASFYEVRHLDETMSENEKLKLEFYYLNRDQIINPKPEREFIAATKKLGDYMMLKYQIHDDELDHFLMLIDNLMMFDVEVDEIIEMFDPMFETKQNKNRTKFVELLTNLNNNMRKWSLLGHTPNEVYQLKNKDSKFIQFKPNKK